MPVVLGWYIFLSFSLGLLHAKSDRLCRYVCLSVLKKSDCSWTDFLSILCCRVQVWLQSDKTIRPFGYNRTKISDPFVTIGQKYQTLWLQSDKNIRPFGYNRTKISDPSYGHLRMCYLFMNICLDL